MDELNTDFPFIKILKLETKFNREFCKKNKIMAVPTSFFYYNGEMIERKVGELDRDQLIERITNTLYK